MSMLEELTDLYRYNRWANSRILDACEKLSSEELTRDLKSSFPSVLATLAHMTSAEWIWLERWRGRSPAGNPQEWDTSTLSGVRVAWLDVMDARDEFLARSSEQRLLETLTYTTSRGDRFASPLWKLMRHVVNHATHHRGQVVTMLRQLGAEAPNTDLITYFRLHPDVVV